MASVYSGWSGGNGASTVSLISGRAFDKARVVSVEMTDLTDADTFSAGPGLITCAWEQPTTNTGVGSWRITNRDTGALEWDSGSAAQAGTLWLFYGTFTGGV